VGGTYICTDQKQIVCLDVTAKVGTHLHDMARPQVTQTNMLPEQQDNNNHNKNYKFPVQRLGVYLDGLGACGQQKPYHRNPGKSRTKI
jgi:hypothetical protein